MIFFNANLDDNEIEEKLKELDEDHQREIQKRYDRGEIVNYQLSSSSSTNNDGSGKTLQHHKKIQYNNSNKTNPKEQSTKEESSVKEIFSQKYVGNDYLAEAVLIGNKPYFAVSIKRSLLSNSENIIDTADDKDLISLYETFLKYDGYKVDAFTDPVDALSSFRKDVYDLVLLDLKMPQMNGVELSQKLQNIDPNLFYRFITAANKEYIENLKLNNPDIEKNIIYKPLWLNEIRTTIHSLFCNNDQQ